MNNERTIIERAAMDDMRDSVGVERAALAEKLTVSSSVFELLPYPASVWTGILLNLGEESGLVRFSKRGQWFCSHFTSDIRDLIRAISSL